jgi:hypothetical protein
MKRSQKVLLIGLLLVIVLFFILSANRAVILEQVLPDDIPVEFIEKIMDLPSYASLGELCAGKIDCILFCKNNGDSCMNFCIDKPENEICSAFEPDDFEDLPPEFIPTKSL